MKSYIHNIPLTLTSMGALLFVSCNESSTVFPETCADVQAEALEETGERPENGIYTIYMDGDEEKPWDVYCHNMNRNEPAEYLTVDEEKNYSEITTVGNETVTSYRRFRIDPIRLEIDPLDDTFATTEGEAEFIPDGRDHIPAGWAQFGHETADGDGIAKSKVNLAGTPFSFTEEIVANNLAFFCVDTEDNSGNDDLSITEVSSDLMRFELRAHNTSDAVWVKNVADCDHMGGTDDLDNDNDFVNAAWPLQYTGN